MSPPPSASTFFASLSATCAERGRRGLSGLGPLGAAWPESLHRVKPRERFDKMFDPKKSELDLDLPLGLGGCFQEAHSLGAGNPSANQRQRSLKSPSLKTLKLLPAKHQPRRAEAQTSGYRGLLGSPLFRPLFRDLGFSGCQ